VLTTVVVEVVMLTVLVWNSIRIAETHLIQQTENRINEILPLLNASLGAPLLDYDIAVLEELLVQIIREQGVRYIELSTGSDRTVITYGTEHLAEITREPRNHRIELGQEKLGEILEVTTPIVVASRTIGNMRVQFNISYIVQAVQALRAQGAVIATIEVVLSIILLTLLGLALTRHLKDLTSATQKLADGDLTVRVPENNIDEIGQTARAFNEMATTRMRVESALRALACTSIETGNNFFEDAVKMLNDTFASKYAFIGLLDQNTHDHIYTKTVAMNDEIAPNFDYALQHTPCENVIEENKRLIPNNVRKLYPRDELLQELGLESYFGAPLIFSNGQKFGLVVVAHTRPLSIEPWMDLLLDVFANRISMELERDTAEKTLRESEAKLQAVMDNAPALISIKDMDGRVTMVNRRFDVLAGPDPEEYVDKDVFDLYPQDMAKEQWFNDLAEIEQNGSLEVEEIIEHKDRNMHTYLTVKFPLLESGRKEPFGICSISTDISERKQAEETIRYMAYRDSLTGLYNRNEFEVRVVNALSSAHEHDHEHVLLYLDLDQFKVVNDTCGHSAGDEMLRQLSAILLKNVRERDTMARLGGDEFGLLMENCPVQRAEQVASHLIEIISNFRFVWEGRTFAVGVSIGIARISRQNQYVAEVLKSADMACYAAKDAGRNRYHLYSEDDQDLAQRQSEMNWVSVIREALDNENFVIFHQPIISLDKNKPDLIMYEHLVRMRAKGDKVILPGSFISSAERYNLMQDVDRCVIREVLAHAYSEYDTRPSSSVLFINLSGTSLNDSDLVNYIRRQFLAFKIEPSRVCFEITETAAIANLHRATQFIHDIRELGCRIALDDFGSGLSSFSYLKALPVDFIKIDGSFVRNMLNEPMDIAIVEAIHQLGQAAGIETIAEFVEDLPTLERLRSIGINYAQGYAIAKPESVAEPIPEVNLGAQQ
jgi:diguanylate cyclase (GGDEF)-like protein/PAS domain S-box-containing protein